RQVRPPGIAGASLPKRAESASAACPAGTTGIALGAPGALGCASGALGGADKTLSGEKILPRLAGTGRPPDGGDANRPGFWACADGAKASANVMACARQTQILMVRQLIPRAFSAEIAANSSRQRLVG